MQLQRILIFLFIFCALPAQATPQAVGAVERIETRTGVSVPIYTRWRDDALATVVLFSGGAGGYGTIGPDGWPSSRNFLIRTGRHWARHPFNIVMVGRPSDGIDLALGGVRTGDQHAADNVAIFKAVKQKSPLPLWLIGTSMGTISAAAAAIRDTEHLVAGLVLTSSVTAYKKDGAVPRQSLEKIRVPTLVFHHEQDACRVCPAHEAKNIARGLTRAPIKKTLIVTGGGGESGNPCEPLHFHGFIGMENEAVDQIARWILNPTD